MYQTSNHICKKNQIQIKQKTRTRNSGIYSYQHLKQQKTNRFKGSIGFRYSDLIYSNTQTLLGLTYHRCITTQILRPNIFRTQTLLTIDIIFHTFLDLHLSLPTLFQTFHRDCPVGAFVWTSLLALLSFCVTEWNRLENIEPPSLLGEGKYLYVIFEHIQSKVAIVVNDP